VQGLGGGNARPVASYPTDAMSPVLAEKLSAATTKPTNEMKPLVDEAFRANALEEYLVEQHGGRPPPRPDDLIPTIANASSRQYPVHPPAPAPPPHQVATGRPLVMMEPQAAPRRNRAPWIIAGAAVAVVLGGGGFAVWKLALDDSGDSGGGGSNPLATADAGVAKPAVDGGVVAATDAGVVAMTDASVVVQAPPPDAAVVKPPSDKLAIISTPPGARVYIDGSDAGVTPLDLPGTPDRHTIALFLAGHELYVAQVDGFGSFSIPLKEVTPSGGPAGIKVIKCKNKERYYVFVDGKPTGQTCPTERIDTVMGPHTVEVYDLESETRRKWDIVVTETRLSYRVRVEN
jgi:hypothetical protein